MFVRPGGSPIRIPFENDTFMCPVIHPSLGYLGLALEVPHSDGRPHRWSLKLDPVPIQVVMKLMLLISVKLYNSSIESDLIP